MKFKAEHFIQVGPPEEPDGDLTIEVWHHPTCAYRIEVGYPGGTSVEHSCGIQYEIDNVGQHEAFGNPEIGWYAARHWREQTPSGPSGWSEITTGTEVVPLDEWATAQKGTPHEQAST